MAERARSGTRRRTRARTHRTGATTAALLLALSGLAAAAGAQPPSQQRKQALEHLLRHDCGSCHGMTLRGGLGPPLTVQALERKPSQALQAIILFGRPGTPMPPWQGMLSEPEVEWLVQRLKSGDPP